MNKSFDDVADFVREARTLTIIKGKNTYVFRPGESVPEELRREVDKAIREGRAEVCLYPAKDRKD